MSYTALSANQFATTAAALNKLKAYAEDPSRFEALLVSLSAPLIVSGQDIGLYVSIGSLVESAKNDQYSQAPIAANAVARVVFGVPTTKIPPLLDGRLLNPPILGYHDDGSFSIIAGRHRLTAILSLAQLVGIDITSPEFLARKVRVLADKYSIDGVQGYNTSRRIRKSESLSTELQKLGIDPTNIGEILEAYRQGAIKVNVLFPSVFLCLVNQSVEKGQIDPGVEALEPTTIVDIATGIPSKFGSKYPAYRPGFKDFDWTQKLLSHSFLALPAALQSVKDAGTTNIALAASGVSQAVVHQMRDKVGKEIAAPIVAPKGAPKVKKETATDTEVANNTTRRRPSKAVAKPVDGAPDEQTNEVI